MTGPGADRESHVEVRAGGTDSHVAPLKKAKYLLSKISDRQTSDGL